MRSIITTNRHTPSILAALAVAMSWPTSARAVSLINGSFETGPSLGGAPFLEVLGGSTTIHGWTVGGVSVDYCGPGTWNISDGVRNIDLDGSGPGQLNGSISQTFDTIAGQNYLVTFDLSGNPAGFPLLKQVQVSAAATTQTFTYDIATIIPPVLPVAITYQSKEFSFTATGSSSTLTFTSLTPLSGTTGFGPVIDNVSVALSSVPDIGATVAMLGMAMASLGLIRRRVS